MKYIKENLKIHPWHKIIVTRPLPYRDHNQIVKNGKQWCNENLPNEEWSYYKGHGLIIFLFKDYEMAILALTVIPDSKYTGLKDFNKPYRYKIPWVK